MKINIQYILLALLVIVVASCTSEEDLIQERKDNNPLPTIPTFDPGSLDLSKYVAIGNSVTSGFADAALYPGGQLNSLPGIIADQFALAGGGEFVYPPISSGFGFGGSDGQGGVRGRSFIDVGAAISDPSQAIQFKSGTPLIASGIGPAGLNNFGVPGARVIDLVTAGYGNFNPFYGAFQSDPTASILADAISAGPTFFSLFIGNNDVLGYAASGGKSGEDFNPLDPTTMTDVASFQAAFQATLDALAATGAEGAVLNIGPVTILPYFQTVTTLAGTYEFIPLDQATADLVNAGYAEYNGGLQAAFALGMIDGDELAARTVAFVAGGNAPVITDESMTVIDLSEANGLPPGTIVLPLLRQANAQDVYPLTAIAAIGSLADPNDPTSVIGVGVPVPDSLTLTFPEQVNVITRTAQFNGVISALMPNYPNMTLVDIQPIFADGFGLTPEQATALALTPAAIAAADGVLGIEVDGFNMVPLSLDANSLFNSIFSTDGIHPNPRGAALVGNEVIDAVNAAFGAQIPPIDVLARPGIFVEGL